MEYVRRLFTLVALASIVAAVAACRSAPTDRPGDERFGVQSVHLVGVEAFDEAEILPTLETRRHAFNPLQSARRFNRFALAADIERIETFYHARGYLEARVTDFVTTEVPRGRRRDRVAVEFTVDEGIPSYLTRVSFDVDELRQVADRAALVAGLGIAVGQRFDHIAVEAARETLRGRLLEEGYAYAAVDVRVYADREAHTVEVYYFFDQGPACLFGAIDVVGNRQIPDELIIARLRLETGNVYRHSLLRRSQVALYDMGTFSFAGVEARLRDQQDVRSAEFVARIERHDRALARRGLTLAYSNLPSPTAAPDVDVAGFLDNLEGVEQVDPNVPIVVTVIEQPGASYRIGGGLGIRSGRTETYARSNALWRNAIAPLNTFEFDARLGYAWLPTFLTSDRDIEGVIGSAQVGYRRPGALFRFADASASVRVERNLRDDYAFLKPSASIAAERRFGDNTRASVGYTWDIIRTDDDAELGGGSCQAVPDQYRLTHADISVQTDRRDNPLQAWSGLFGEMNVEVGVDGPVGEFPYLLIAPDVRYYQPIGRRVSIATRARVSAIADFGDNVPRSQCLYLGGGDTVRGFSERKLSPYVDGVATGGLTSYVFNVEPRFEIGRGWLYGAVFLDAGGVSSGEFDFNFALGGADGLHLASGAGLRVVTPIGPFRLDVGYRITSGPEYADRLRSRLAFFVSIGEAF